MSATRSPAQFGELEMELRRSSTDFHITSSDKVEFFAMQKFFSNGIEGEYFRRLFANSGKVAHWDPPFTSLVLREFFRWIYCGEIDDPLSWECLNDLFEMSDRCEMPTLKKELALFLIQRLMSHRIVKTIILADRFKWNSELKKLCFNYVYRNAIVMDFTDEEEWNGCSDARRLDISTELIAFTRRKANPPKSNAAVMLGEESTIELGNFSCISSKESIASPTLPFGDLPTLPPDNEDF